MPQWLAQGQESKPSNPAIVLAVTSRGDVAVEPFARAGLLMEPFSASYAVFQAASVLTEPEQVFPVSGMQPIDLVADRLSLGRYVARWTAPVDASITGEYQVRWSVVLHADAVPITWSDRLVIVPAGQRLPGYCTVNDMRQEGFVLRDVTDERLFVSIRAATAFIDKVTGRFFEPRYMPFLKVNGSGNRMVLLGDPIIALGAVTLDTSPFSPADLPVDPSLYRVYSRHLTQGLLNPDDRDNPKVELFYSSEDLIGRRAPYSFTSLIWPRGQQNVTLEGIYGYTDPNGGFVGDTPEAIRNVCKAIAAREIYTLKNRDRREDARKRWALVSESTRDQSYNLDPNRNAGLSQSFTGDPEIDQVLAMYLRPPIMGAA